MSRRRGSEEPARQSTLNANARRVPLWRSVIWRTIWLTNWTILILFFGAVGTLAGTYYSIAPKVPLLRSISEVRGGEGTRILSSDGVLLGRVATENREFVSLEQIPEELKDAIIAIEDTHFYQHTGVDPWGILRAVKENVTSGRVRQGASTITQQLARNMYDLSTERTVRRKVQEFVLALQIERAYTKEEILELYLNEIPFGERSFGVKVAARTYFGKSLPDLTLAECAMLAALPKGPTRYNPFRSPDRAEARRNLVLDRMATVGFISHERNIMAQQQPLRLSQRRSHQGRRTFIAPYFCSFILKKAAALPGVGQDRIDRGGIIIQTTLNSKLQEEAEDALIEGVRRHRRSRVSQGALVAVDIQTGAVKTMVGGVDPNTSEFNRATQGNRPVGSAFKPFVYLTALNQGMSPDDRIPQPQRSYRAGGGKWWTPHEYGGGLGSGRPTLRDSLRYSRNFAAVATAYKVGIRNVIATAQLLGLRGRMDPVLPLALGTCSSTPLEMASAYAVIANGGYSVEPYGIIRVQDATGNVLYEHHSARQQIVPKSSTEGMADMMRGVVERGTASSAWRAAGRQPSPAFGKTGTTSQNKDAWFIGWSQGLSCAVWVGNDQEREMGHVTGGSIPAPIWMKFMKVAAPEFAKSRSAAVLAASKEDAQRELERLATEAEQPEPPVRRDRRQPDEQDTGDAVPPDQPHDNRQAQPPDPVTTNPRFEEPLPEPQPAHEPDTEVAAVCAVTGKLATSYCPRIVLRSYPRGRAPSSTCALHPDPFQER